MSAPSLQSPIAGERPVSSPLDAVTLRALALCVPEVAGVLEELSRLTPEQRGKVAQNLSAAGVRDDVVACVMRIRVEIVRWLARRRS